MKKKKTFQQILAEKTVGLDEIIADFTPEERLMMEVEVKKYDMLVMLRKLRKKLGLTQAKLADIADVPRTTITKIESGSYNPTIETLSKIATALNKKLEIKFV